MALNPEKQKIIEQSGNVLVTANPGTGKTMLLAYKYADFIEKGIPSEKILCLTFTEKAKREMEQRILDVLKEKELKVDLSNLNVYTFHGYALECIDENQLISSNLLRYSIYKYIKNNEILNYGNDYIIDTIVPKIENSIRYLKSFGIKPEDIDVEKIKPLLEGTKTITKEEIEKFSEHYYDIYKFYEQIKEGKGIDYSDMLIKFLELEDPQQYHNVLVDELQDANKIEAQIALKSAENFFVVGDKKQAIFGFQGGSTENFELFSNSEKFVLSENFRSTDQVLSYSRSHFSQRTNDESQKQELKDLKSANNKEGEKPVVYDVDKKKSPAAACEMASKLKGKTAIVTRTNTQIQKIANEMDARGMEYASTFFSASKDAKMHVIDFIKGLMSNDPEDLKAAIFTPFSPVPMQEAFETFSEKYVNKDKIMEKCPAFRKMRDNVKNVEDINQTFLDVILPISISYGRDYYDAASTLHEAYQESLRVIKDKSIDEIIAYLKSTDLISGEAEEGNITLITVHKAKGKQFDNVIYLPSKPSSNTGLVDNIVEAVLSEKKINTGEEISEEKLRIDFVSFTRAKNNLFILTDKVQDYIDENASLKEMDASHKEAFSGNKMQRAYSLFVNGKTEEAQKELNQEGWIRDLVKKHFDNLEKISFSSLPDKAYDYLVNQILNVPQKSEALTLGNDVHNAIESYLKNPEKEIEISEEVRPYFENAKNMISEIKKKYPEVYEIEDKFQTNLNKFGFNTHINLKGFIDAVFTDGENYLIVDWKTSKKDNQASKHRQQLEAYRRVFSLEKNIDIRKVYVAIGYVGLRGSVNLEKVDYKLDEKQPTKKSFETFSKKVNKILEWRNNVDSFFNDLAEEKVDDHLWRAVIENYKEEQRD